MSTFEGFTEPEEQSSERFKESIKGSSLAKKMNKKPRSFVSRDQLGKMVGLEPIPEGAKLSTDFGATAKQNDKPEALNGQPGDPDLLKNINSSSELTNGDSSSQTKDSQENGSPTTLKESAEEENRNKLDLLKERRAAIERENKKKKEMLLQTIAARKKQTNNEAEKLKLVQQELASIDQELSVDVKYLMDAIQTASVDFTDAQKRYDRIEKEFVFAKMDLQSKSEKKELLMEHLATIIEQNELRKAKKLEKIMSELGLT